MISALILFLLFTLAYADSQECRIVVKEVVRAVYGTGYVKSKEQVLLRSSVSGYVKKLYVSEGDRVRKGDVLTLIDSGGLESKIKALERRIEVLKKKLKGGSHFREVFREEILLKEENLKKLENRLRRRRKLYEKGVIPKEALEESERLYALALREYRIALSRFRSTIEELEGELESLIEEKHALERERDKYILKSPIDGLVLRLWVEEGDYLNPLGGSNAVVSLGSEDKEVVLRIDEEFAPLVSEGKRVYVTSDAFPEQVFEGTVREIELESDPARRVVEVKVSLELPKSIPVNSLVEGNIVVSRLKTTVVPSEAIRDGKVTLLVKGERRTVKVNRVFNGYGEVLGYPAGTRCLVQP